jgi:hypothetical protein
MDDKQLTKILARVESMDESLTKLVKAQERIATATEEILKFMPC